MSTKYTPGPWTACPHPTNWHEISIQGNERGKLGDTTEVATVWDSHENPTEVARANAYLIAAAPDLLEIGKLLLDSLLDGTYDPNGDHKSSRIILATEAIAKATGGAK